MLPVSGKCEICRQTFLGWFEKNVTISTDLYLSWEILKKTKEKMKCNVTGMQPLMLDMLCCLISLILMIFPVFCMISYLLV